MRSDNYWADIFKDGDRHFYRVGETAVEISEFEYGYVLANPNMYYFSQTLKVYVRLLRARRGSGGPGQGHRLHARFRRIVTGQGGVGLPVISPRAPGHPIRCSRNIPQIHLQFAGHNA